MSSLLILGAAALATSLGASTSLARSADPVRLTEASVSVEMPGQPSCTEGRVEAPWGEASRRVCTYFDSEQSLGFTFERLSLPAGTDADQSDAILEAVMAGAAAMTESEVASKKSELVQGIASLRGKLLTPKNGFVADVHYLLAEDRLITISVEGSQRAMALPAASNFMASLRIQDATE